VPSSFTGAESVISFNPHYLLDGLAAAAVCGAAIRTPAPGAGRGTGGEAGAQDGAGPAPAQPEPGRIRLEFTSPAKPALITWAGYDPDLTSPAGPDAAEGGARSDAGGTPPGEDGASQPGAPESAASEPEFRYLVVPLRSPAGPGPARG
jgi:DNA polymerase III sliding clamp (beta) subunit (PCNA family)